MTTSGDEEEAFFQPELLPMSTQAIAPNLIPTFSRRNSGRSSIFVKKSFAEFFAGIGLVRLALVEEGWETVFANDIDADKFEIYSKNFSASEFRLGDIQALREERLPDSLLATASFPCTDLSLAGARRGLEGKQSGTLWSFFDIIAAQRARRPKFLLLENVAGFLSSHGGKDFRATIQKLNSLGYDCDVYFLNAQHFVPQSRQRLFLFAVAKGADLPYMTASDSGTVSPLPARPKQLVEAIRRNADLSWRLASVLPPLPPLKSNLKQFIERLPQDSPLWWSPTRQNYLLSQLSPAHRETLKHLKNSSVDQVATAYRRMRLGRIRAEIRCDGVSGCLRTPRGGSSRQIVIVAGKGVVRVRHMTPREYARLQGVPDDFVIGDSVTKALFGFGDAVCVPAVRWLVKNIVNPAAVAFVGDTGASVRNGNHA